jgi:hypothetical protein
MYNTDADRRRREDILEEFKVDPIKGNYHSINKNC